MKKISIILSFLIIAFLGYWFLIRVKPNPNYANHISIYRHERSEFFRYSPDSPFLIQKVNFTYLDYFPANPDFRIEAKFEKSAKPDTLELPTSTGTTDKFIILGKARFQLKEKVNTLLVLGSTNPNDKTLFIPFLDKTSGNSTYGAGRYLDIEPSNGNTILLDFNKSYNPYCAYTDGYTCPFPPKENRLSIVIAAGEKSYSVP